MNSRMKRFQAVSLALLVLLNCLFTAAQNPLPKTGKVFTDYGLESELRIPSKIMRSSFRPITSGSSVRAILKSLLVFSEAGGIMFDAVGKPCAGLANGKLWLTYNRKHSNGQGLTLHVGKRAYSVAGIRDDDLQPIATFADSSIPVLTNLQYPDAPIREVCPLGSHSLWIVTLHPAFRDTHLGRRLTSMDSIPWSFSRGKRWDKLDEPLPDVTLSLAYSVRSAMRADEAEYSTMWPIVRVGLINDGANIMRSLRAEYKEYYASLAEARSDSDWESDEDEILAEPGIDKSKWRKLSVEDRRILLTLIESVRYERVSNINDDEAPPSFCTQGSTVSLDGTPNLQFIAPWYAETYPLPKSSSLMTKNISQLQLVDQEAYDGMMKIYRLGGLFRYAKQQSPFLWKRFLRSLPPAEKKETYTLVCPACKKSDVEKWLACVERNFPSEPIKSR